MTSILSFLKALWPWRRRRTRAAEPPPPEHPLVDAAPEPIPAIAIISPPELEPPAEDERTPEEPRGEENDGDDDEDEDEDEGEEDPDDWAAQGEAEDEDPMSPDPFISAEGPIIEAFSPDMVRLRRTEALVLASSGEHKIFLSDVAGPGTLAEALDRLLQEGRVTAEFRDDAAEGPYILYRPLDRAGA
jgi:hypothetical protein